MGNGKKKTPPPGVVAKPDQYMNRPVQIAPGGQKSVLARARRSLAPAQPDPQSPKIGGRWQDEPGTFNAMINQAGSHIECWVTPASTMLGIARQVFRLGGDRTSDSEFSLYVYPDPTKASGKVQLLAPDKLQMTLTSQGVTQTSTLIPIDPTRPGRPTLSDAAIALLPPEAAIFKIEEQFPLTRQERQLLKDKLGVPVLAPLIHKWLGVGSGTNVADRVEREHAAGQLDAHVGKVFAAFHPDSTPLVRERARNVVAVETLTFEKTERTVLDWLGRIVNQNDQEGFNASKTPNMKGFLGLGASGRTQPFLYQVEYLVEGFSGDFGIGLGGFVGAIIITKRDGPNPTDKLLFKQQYEMWFGGISAGPSVGFQIGVLSNGSGTSFADYAPTDFPGWVTFIDGSAKAGAGVGPQAGIGGMEIHGNGAQPSLFIDTTGATAVGGSVQGFAGLYLGAELGFSAGRILKIGNKFPKRTFDTRLPSVDYAVDAKANAQVHFVLGDAFLTPKGRQLVRIFCAAELATLTVPGSNLDIEGHADRVDTAQRNNELSLLRAKNIMRAVKDVLGSALAVTDDRIATRGLGERRAAEAHDVDGSVNPNFRKVEIVLDGRLSVTFVGG